MNSPATYELHCLAKRVGKSAKPFLLRVSSPAPHAEHGYQCTFECPVIAKQPITLYSSEAEHAYALCFRFVRPELEHGGYILIHADGGEVRLPDLTDEQGVVRSRTQPPT